MTESLPSSDPGTQKRRSTRIVQAVPITVTGVDALGQPFKERTTTVMVNCHGCKYQSKHYVPKNSIVTIEIPRPQLGPARSVQGRVVWVQRPRTVRELFQIGLEFETPGNVWGIAFPPEDWEPFMEELGAQIPAPAELAAVPESTAAQRSHPESVATSPENIEAPAAFSTASEAAPPALPPSATTPPEGKIHVVPTPPQDVQAALSRQMAKMVADAKESLDKTLRKGANAAITEEMMVVRQQLDVQLHDAVEKAIKVSMERVSESAVKRVVQQAADRTASIVEEARKASEITAEHLDAKIRSAVESAVKGAADQAAQQAAQQTAAQSLKHAVEEAVERAIRERAASTPSLEILSSPQAAQKHLDEWKKTLEEAAQNVRNQTVEQTSAESAAAARNWQQEFETTLDGATHELSERLNEASKAALAQAEKDIAERSASLRGSLDEVVAGAANTIETLGATLKQERNRAEETKAELQQATQSALVESHRRIEELLASQSQEMQRKADDIVAERIQQIEPTLESAAQKVAERLSGHLDQTLIPKLDQVQGALSQLDSIEQKAAELERSIRQQADQVSQQAAQIQAGVAEQARRASDQAVEEALARLRQQTEPLSAEVEQRSREIAAKIEQELEQKSTETQHETYEALLKASDWYQKKAQTTMQSTLERAVEQSTSALRDRAAEISSLLASELDHYRRTYVEHSAAQIEETAKEVVDRERARLNETAETATAGFSDQVHRVAGDSLRRFEHAAREALEKARSDMEYNREGSLAAFQQKLDERLQEGIELAREQLQSQLLPLMQAWETNREAQQQEWREQLKKSTDESIEQYKARLENASNSWLLASATTLGQHSQTVLDTIAKAAEKRLRDTCANVLAGMGDTLKERLIGMSSEFGSEEDVPPKTKK